jgi:outer membrane protein insertion porin family
MALAQVAGAQNYVPKQIMFAGSTAAQGELLAASGLKPGSPLTQQEMQAAAQKLMDTGAFSDIRFAFDGAQLLYTLKPAELQPVSYLNFPWWQQDALNAAVAAKVPLFHGAVAPESPMQQAVADALQTLLASKGIAAARVSAVPVMDLGGGAVKGVQYRIDSPAVQVGAVTFSGANPAWNPTLDAIAKAAAGQNFDGATEETLLKALTAVYHRQGYLKMQMTGFAHGEPQIAGEKVLVPVMVRVVDGPLYHVGSLQLTGDVLMKPEDFAKSAQLHAGDAANEDLLRATMAALGTPYRQHGYLRAKIDAVPQFDDTNRTVSYTITVQPGPVFTMGELKLINLNDAQKAEVLRYWPLHQGDVYDATVALNFLLRNKNNLPSLRGWSGTWKAYEHEDTHVVNLEVTFRQGGVLE